MEDSAMDMTTMCNGSDGTKKELLAMQEQYETLFQENYELKKKNELLEKMNFDLESELSFSSNGATKEKAKQKCLQNELDTANSKISQLERLLEDEKSNAQTLLHEFNALKKVKESNNNAVVLPNQEEINILTAQIVNLEALREEDQLTIKEQSAEKASYIQTINELKCDMKHLQDELTETRECLKQKTKELHNTNETLESTREEKLLLATELQILKASDSNAARGNSLFAEVEENRQKVAAQRELLKQKYLNLKKVLSQKQVENNKLKLEIVKIRREEKEDERTVHRDYSDLICTYKERVSDLEKKLKELEIKKNEGPILGSGGESSELQWVNTVVENARKETRNLQAELESRSSNYVIQGHQLFDSQKENRKLRATTLKMQSEIDELRLKLDTIKQANEVDDGISPPATDIAIQYQKQKTVKFKEVLHDRSNSSRDSSLCEKKESDKEN